MTKVSRNRLSEGKMGLYVEEFWRAVTLLESKDEVKEFFRDIFTATERTMLAKRLQIAKLLYVGSDYDFIKKELHVSNTTIAAVARWLDSFGTGYRVIIPRLLADKKTPALPDIWNANPPAKALAGALAIGAGTASRKMKKLLKKRSVLKDSNTPVY